MNTLLYKGYSAHIEFDVRTTSGWLALSCSCTLSFSALAMVGFSSTNTWPTCTLSPS